MADHLGTLRELVAESGEVVWAADYRLWGGMRRLWTAVDGNAAEVALIHRELVAEELRYPLQRAHAFTGDFRTNAVATENGDLCLHIENPPRIGRCAYRAARRCSYAEISAFFDSR